MKKVLIVAATAGLMTLAACTPAATNNTVDNGDEANTAVYNDVEPLPVDNSTNTVEVTNTAEGNMAGNAM